MPTKYEEPFRISPQVELLSKKFLTFEDAADLLANAVGSKKISNHSAQDLLRASESLQAPGVSLVSFQSIGKIAQSLREEWTTWPKKRRLKRSPFLLVKGRLEVNLHPVYLGDLGLGLRGQAGTLLHRWVEELQCIPLGFKELSPAGKHGAVVAASPFVHFYMHFEAVGFAPKKGDWLRGRVCETQIEAGLNVTLVGLANCHISSQHLPKALRFCKDTNRWLGLQEEEDARTLRILEYKCDKEESPPVVYVRVVDDIVLDRFQQSGKMFEINCRLGYPEKDMPKILKEAQAAEEEEEKKRLERRKSERERRRSSQKNGTGDTCSSKLPEADEQETAASSASKKKKHEVVEEETAASPATKKGKRKLDDEETTASSTGKKKKDEDLGSPSPKKKEEGLTNGRVKAPRKKEDTKFGL